MPRLLSLALLLLAACGLSACAPAPAAVPLQHKWLYVSQNLLPDENVPKVEELFRRAAKVGYNGAVIADYKLNLLGDMDPRYFRHVERLKVVAKELGLELIPCVFPVGYSGGLLYHDPNLVEALPVRDAPFRVSGGRADLAPDPDLRLQNGDFEQGQGDRAVGWELQDAPGKGTFLDHETKHSGGAALRIENIGAANAPSGNGRIAQPLSLKPFRCYRLSFWAKTRGFETPGDFTVRLLLPGNKRSLTHLNLGLQADQDWKQHQVVFNSLDRPDVRLYLGVWGGRGGALWLDDLRLEEVGLVNLVRREGCPLEVRGADGTLYEEGKDFQPVQDPKLGTVPWRGDYSLYHEAPKIELTPGSRIREGETLRVSFYHAAFVYDMQATCCLTHPKVYSLLRDQMERVEKLFHPTTVFMQHDEIRVANWCGLCRAQHKTPGQLLAENVRRCRQIVREVSPRARVYVWSDMFDPNHNARDDYFLVNGSWAGSWEGLQPETGIVNWYYDARSKNLPFFADRGHEQILAGYYDNGVDYTVRWLNDARGIKGVTGVMYTTWANRYADLEKFAQAVWGGAEGKPGGKPEASAGSSAQAPARNR